LHRTIIRSHGVQSLLAKAVKYPWKEQVSLVFYCVAVGVAFWHPLIAMGLLVVVAGMWLVPDRRIERAVEAE
jgi:hypothetical protein